tara:strand:- start:165 stop:1562 length:1398 start_codon:yes stop_codon:yes gene_type:complete
MQVKETNSEGLKREFSVVVPKEDFDSRLNERLIEVGTSVNVPGFRPGKVPLSVLKKRFGGAVRGEILERTLQETIQKTVEEKELRPAMEPKVDLVTFEDGVDIEYKLSLEVIPEIEPIDFSSVQLEKLIPEIPVDEVDASIARIAEQQRSYLAVDKKTAENEDQLLVDFIGTIDGEAFDGGTAEAVEIVLGKNQFIPGFEEQLIGAKAGEKREVNVVFPEEYPADNLKGKNASFDVNITEVREPVTVQINDEFAKKMGAENIDAFRATVADQISAQYNQLSRGRLKKSLLDKLGEGANFEVPPTLLEQEFNNIWKTLQEAKEKDQLEEEDKGKTEEELENRYREIAAQRIRLGLLLAEIGRKNNLSVSQEDLNKAMGEQVQRFPGQEANILKYYKENPEAMQELHAPLLEEKIVDYVLELAMVTERKVTIEELMADPEQVSAEKPSAKKRKKKKTSRGKAKRKGK